MIKNYILENKNETRAIIALVGYPAIKVFTNNPDVKDIIDKIEQIDVIVPIDNSYGTGYKKVKGWDNDRIIEELEINGWQVLDVYEVDEL